MRSSFIPVSFGVALVRRRSLCGVRNTRFCLRAGRPGEWLRQLPAGPPAGDYAGLPPVLGERHAGEIADNSGQKCERLGHPAGCRPAGRQPARKGRRRYWPDRPAATRWLSAGSLPCQPFGEAAQGPLPAEVARYDAGEDDGVLDVGVSAMGRFQSSGSPASRGAKKPQLMPSL